MGNIRDGPSNGHMFSVSTIKKKKKGGKKNKEQEKDKRKRNKKKQKETKRKEKRKTGYRTILWGAHMVSAKRDL
jgi:hypothetical protein